MGLAVNVISLLELRGDGLQFSNYGSPLSLDDQFSMLIITAMLLVDSIIYLLIAWWDVCTHIHIYMGVFVISADTDNVVVYCTVFRIAFSWRYINEVKPGQYGIPRKPYFFLQTTYWTGKPSLCCKRVCSILLFIVICSCSTFFIFTLFALTMILPLSQRTVTPFSNEDVDHHDIDENDDHDLSVHELITPEPQAGIEITNLHKKFKVSNWTSD